MVDNQICRDMLGDIPSHDVDDGWCWLKMVNNGCSMVLILAKTGEL